MEWPARIALTVVLSACGGAEPGDYDPLDPPVAAERMTLAVDEKQCDEPVTLEELVSALEHRGVRAYTPAECTACGQNCLGCDCDRPRLFVVRIEPDQIDLAEDAGWTASSWMANASCGDMASVFECPY